MSSVYQLCRVIQNLLSDRRFYVELNNERSRWRIQKNGLPHLSPTLFNIYTNDQPILDGTRSFIYADDLCITSQYPTFQEVEQIIDTLLQKQQSACESRQDASHGVSSAEQRGQEVATSIMEWSGPGEH